MNNPLLTSQVTKLAELLLATIEEDDRDDRAQAWATEIASQVGRYSEADELGMTEEEALERLLFWWGSDGVETPLGEPVDMAAEQEFALSSCYQRELQGAFSLWRKSGISPDEVVPYLVIGDFSPALVGAFLKQGISPERATKMTDKDRWKAQAEELLNEHGHPSWWKKEVIAEALRDAYIEGRVEGSSI